MFCVGGGRRFVITSGICLRGGQVRRFPKVISSGKVEGMVCARCVERQSNRKLHLDIKGSYHVKSIAYVMNLDVAVQSGIALT